MSNEHMNIVIVGHVDHGKSTIIGRLLADTNTLPEGKLEKIKHYCQINSKPFEYAFLLDALADEQAQGITIDIARCFFKTRKRKYLLLDAPGHIEFIKNLVTGAANAEAAFLVIDAHEGIQENTRRHAYLLSLLKINQIVVLVNKIDLIDYDEMKYNKIKDDFTSYLNEINLKPSAFIPVSGRNGDNLTGLSKKLPWYNGKAVLESLDSFYKAVADEKLPFRLYVQDVYKFTKGADSRRIIAGQISSGTLRVGDEVIFHPSGKSSKVKTIEAFNSAPKNFEKAGYSTGFTLTEQLYVTRGNLVSIAGQEAPFIASTINVSLFWLGKKQLEKNKAYTFKLGTHKTKAIITEIFKVFDTSSLEIKNNLDQILTHQAGECQIRLLSPITYDAVSELSEMRRFVLIDEFDVAGGGLISSHVEEKKSDLNKRLYGQNRNPIIPQPSLISYQSRCEYYKQEGQIFWFTGLSGSGKSTLAVELERKLIASGKIVCLLDGDNIRQCLNSDLGFDEVSRKENVRRVAELAIFLAKQSFIVLVSLISPHRDMRNFAREKSKFNEIDFSEVFVDASIEACRQRDPKGLYQVNASGNLENFTGIDMLYEPPFSPELHIQTDMLSVEKSVQMLLSYFHKAKVVRGTDSLVSEEEASSS